MSDRRTILITNILLSDLGGTEVVVRDLALGLLRRGHRPIVYSPTLGHLAEEIAARGVSVIDDLRRLGEAPDIIHAHHSIPCGEALIRFPDTPAIFVCHAFNHWVEAPIHFPQIGAYVAVDEACRDRLVHTEGIDPDRVLIFHNGVDLSRIPGRPALVRERPQRAAAFGKAAAVPELRTACAQLGILFDAIGPAAGRISDFPEEELVHYDLVFASARAALEALCCGCAVIACDSRGVAGLVTSRNFDTLRAMNFGLRALTDPVTVDGLVAQIGRYDADDASRVAERARADADLCTLLDKFDTLYEEVLTGARRPPVDVEARERAVGRFLHENLPRRPADPRWPWRAERERLTQEIEMLTHKAGALTSRADELQRELATTQRELDKLQRELAATVGQLDKLKRSRPLKIERRLRRIIGLPEP
jgi:Glycosyltransferase Family 4